MRHVPESARYEIHSVVPPGLICLALFPGLTPCAKTRRPPGARNVALPSTPQAEREFSRTLTRQTEAEFSRTLITSWVVICRRFAAIFCDPGFTSSHIHQSRHASLIP